MGMGDEYSGGVRSQKPTNIQKVLLPVIGLFLIATALAIAYVLSTPAHEFLSANLNGIPAPTTQDGPMITLAIGGGIFLILIMFYAMLFAAFAPKPPKGVTEAELDKEKKERLREKQRQEDRKKQMRAKMREANKNAPHK